MVIWWFILLAFRVFPPIYSPFSLISGRFPLNRWYRHYHYCHRQCCCGYRHRCHCRYRCRSCEHRRCICKLRAVKLKFLYMFSSIALYWPPFQGLLIFSYTSETTVNHCYYCLLAAKNEANCFISFIDVWTLFLILSSSLTSTANFFSVFFAAKLMY